MLANLKHLNLSLEQLNILKAQLLLLNNLNGNLLATLLVNTSLDKTILSLTKGLHEIVKIMEVGISNGLLDLLNPDITLLLGVQVVDSPLVGEDEHEWVQNRLIILGLLHLRLDEDAGKRLHIFVLLVTLVLVGVKLLAEEDVPVLAELATLLLLLDDCSLDMDGVLSLTLITGFLIRSHWQTADAVSHG